MSDNMILKFEWDIIKAELNLSKHTVSFGDATSVFFDPLARIFEDEDHSINEHREIIIGHNSIGRLMVISFTERTRGIIRIISARPATKTERKDYEENRKRN